MASDKKKGISWFNNVLSQPNVLQESKDLPQLTEGNFEVIEHSINDIEIEEKNQSKDIFSKDDQDKIALDVIVSIENILKDRQLLSFKKEGLEEQLQSANETINRLKQDLIKKEQMIQEKSKESRELESKLTNKQMNYDQLLEDYKEYQLTSKMEYEKLTNQLETSTIKYAKLNEEFTNAQYQSMLKINSLEDTIRNLEIENKKYAEQYEKIADEKKKLMQTINDFTEKMSFSFSTKIPSEDKSE